MVQTSLEKCSTGPPMVGTFRVIYPLNVPTIETPRRQKGNEKFSCFVIEVEKIFSHLLGAMYPIHRTHVDPCIGYMGPDLGPENFEMDGYRWFEPAWKNVLRFPRWWERLGFLVL